MLDIKDLLAALQSSTAYSGNLRNQDTDPEVHGTTGTGLDQLIELINNDSELERRISNEDIREGAQAADGMNTIIVEAIKATGVANDGALTASDIYSINTYIRTNHLDEWLRLHGDDESNQETGFHNVQNDGAITRLYDQSAVNTVADGIYHLGFEIKHGRVLNEDGNYNQTVEDLAVWLNDLLEEDLADGSLANPDVTPYAMGTTGTGLDQLVELITNDMELNRRLSTEEIAEGARAANAMNEILVDAIRATGAANDGDIGLTEMRDISAYIRDNHQAEWTALHGDDEYNEETGFHKVQNDGAVSRLYDENAINTVADGIYHMGFATRYDRYLNEDGNSNQRVETVMEWLNELLKDDLEAGTLSSEAVSVDPDALAAATILTLDAVSVDGRPAWRQPSGHEEVESPAELNLANGTVAFGFSADQPQSSSTQTLFSKDASGYGNGEVMAYLKSNKLYVRIQDENKSTYFDSGEVIIEAGQRYDVALSFGEDGVHLYLNGEKVDNDPQLEFSWTGNDADLLVGASGEGRSDSNPTWTWNYFDGTIEDFTVYNRALNNAEVAHINQAGPLPRFQAGDAAIVAALPNVEQGSGLLGEIYDHSGYFRNVAELQAHIETAEAPTHTFDAQAIDFGNHSDDDKVSGFLGGNGTLTSGDGATSMSTIGFHLTGYVYVEAGEHDITVRSADGFLLKLGGETFSSHQDPRSFHATSEEGDFSGGLYQIELFYYERSGSEGLRLEIDGEIVGPERFYRSVEDFSAALEAHGPAPEVSDTPFEGSTGTGLDALIDAIVNDPGLQARISEEEILEGAQAADGMNAILVAAIQATGVANDGRFTASDMHDLNAYIQAHHQQEWITLHGDDESNEETGFHKVQNDGGATRAFGDNAINTVADGLYHIGFAIDNGYFENEDGNRNTRLETTAYWLNELLAQELEDGTLANAAVDAEVKGTTGTGLDQLIELINNDSELERRISNEDIREGAQAADGMNTIIAEAIEQTGVGNDSHITASDMYDLNTYIRNHYETEWQFFHGDDENSEETGFHKVQNDGAITRLYDQNAVNTVADGIYHMGFEIERGRFLNEDGNANASVESVATWLNALLKDDLEHLVSGDGGDNQLSGTEARDRFVFVPQDELGIGNDVIKNFSLTQEDRIVIGDQTVKLDFDHLDSDGDGLDDHTLISLHSEDNDPLGTITVEDQLLTAADVEVEEVSDMGVVYRDNVDLA